MIDRKLLAAFALASSLALGGCNTIAGLGRDVESLGDKVEDCAEDRCRDD